MTLAKADCTEPDPTMTLAKADCTKPDPTMTLAKADCTEPDPTMTLAKADCTEPDPTMTLAKADCTKPDPTMTLAKADFTDRHHAVGWRWLWLAAGSWILFCLGRGQRWGWVPRTQPPAASGTWWSGLGWQLWLLSLPTEQQWIVRSFNNEISPPIDFPHAWQNNSGSSKNPSPSVYRFWPQKGRNTWCWCTVCLLTSG